MASIQAEASAEELAELAARDSSIWDEVLAHPSCYPELQEWIERARAGVDGDLELAPGVASTRVAPPSAERPADTLLSVPHRSIMGVVLLGIGIGIVIGAVLSTVLIVIVLPGLFGGGLG